MESLTPADGLTFGVDDFARCFGATAAEQAVIAAAAAGFDFRYRRLTRAERDAVILGVLERLDGFTRVGEHRSDIWESCWSDAKQAFVDADGDLAALNPVFMGAHPVIRLGDDYARPDDPRFETAWFGVLRHWLFARYLGPGGPAANGGAAGRHVMEFGCGSGFNLAAAARMFPDLHLTGLDWSPSAVALVDSIGARYGYDMRGRRFDFFAPDPALETPPGTIALTFAALEQTGGRCDIFANWLLNKRPALVISMEPIADFYDEGKLFDYLALSYHRRREYLDGYLGWVQAQADKGTVEIIDARRLGFGSLYHEAYSLVVWRPTAAAA